MKKKPVRLTHIQSFQLISWLQSQRKTLDDKRLTYAEAAKLAATALGFPVMEASVTSICRDAGITWSRPTRSHSGGGAESGNNSAALARYVRVLYLAICGIEPVGLGQIIGRHRVTQLFTDKEREILRGGIPIKNEELDRLLDWRLEAPINGETT